MPKVCPETSFFEILGVKKKFRTLIVSLCFVNVYLGLEIRGNLGLKSDLLNLKSVEGFPREGSTPSLGIAPFPERESKRAKMSGSDE